MQNRKRTAWKKNRRIGEIARQKLPQILAALKPFCSTFPDSQQKLPILIEENPSRNFVFPISAEQTVKALENFYVSHICFKRVRKKDYDLEKIPLMQFLYCACGVSVVVIYPWPADLLVKFGFKKPSQSVRKHYSSWNNSFLQTKDHWYLKWELESLRNYYLKYLIEKEILGTVPALKKRLWHQESNKQEKKCGFQFAVEWTKTKQKNIYQHSRESNCCKYSSFYYCERADVCYDKDDFTRAIADYTKSIEINPKSVKAYQGRGNAYDDTSYSQKAMKDYDKALEIDPNDECTYSNRGICRSRQGDYIGAIVDYTKAIEIQPTSFRFHNLRGLTYDKQCNYAKAIIDFNKAIELKPRYAPAYFNRGNSFRYQGNLDKAIADYTRVIEIRPGHNSAYEERGLAQYEKENFEEAIKDYNKAIEISPLFASGTHYMNRGNAYDKLGYSQKAIDDYNKAIEIEKENFNFLFSCLMTIYNGGLHSTEIEREREKANFNPYLAAIYYNRGLAYSNRCDYAKAIDDYTKAIKLFPDRKTYNNRAYCSENNDDYEGAIADYTKAIVLDPKYSKTYINRGQVFEKQGILIRASIDYEKAIDITTEILKTDTKDFQAYYLRGLAYHHKGNYDEAIANFTKNIEFFPKNNSVYYYRGLSHRHKGDIQSAIKDYIIALQLKDMFTCSQAVHELGNLGVQAYSALPYLIKAREHKNIRVRQAIKETLLKIQPSNLKQRIRNFVKKFFTTMNGGSKRSFGQF